MCFLTLTSWIRNFEGVLPTGRKILVFHLKTEQIAVLHGLMNKRNVFALLPTGYGKSMCFTLPPLLLDELDWNIQHVAVVV